jgi:SAM-dependent methyltransferase
MAGAESRGLARHREELLRGAAGRVLELGGGTGANVPYYGDAVTELVVTEPDAHMARRLERRLRERRLPARVVRAPAEALPLESGSFDVVVSTLVLCTVEDPARALAEARRVLAPAGRLLFIEHVRSEDPRLARWQDRLRGPWAWFGCGCQVNRPTVESVRTAGFDLAELRRERLEKVIPIARPLRIGVARRGPEPVRPRPTAAP